MIHLLGEIHDYFPMRYHVIEHNTLYKYCSENAVGQDHSHGRPKRTISMGILHTMYNDTHKGLHINSREGGLENGEIAGPKLFAPPPT